MDCDFEVDAEDAARVVCLICGRRLPRKWDDPARHLGECKGAGPRRPTPKKQPVEAPAVIPCIHRGAELRRAPCEVGCAPGRMLPIFACAAREGGECSATRIFKTQALGRGLPLCTKCNERVPCSTQAS